jgi:hypothetical protein
MTQRRARRGIMRGALSLIFALLLVALAAACGDGSAPEPSPTSPPSASPAATASPTPTPTVVPEVTSPAPTPSPESVVCAADSSAEFQAAQAESDFAMYCPTFLPAGLALQELRFTALDATPEMDAPAPGELNAAFVSADNETQVVLYEGHLGASFVSSLVGLAGDEAVSPEPVAFGDLEGTRYAPLTTITDVTLGTFVIVELPDGITHVLHTAEVDVPTVRLIAAGMQSVSP